MYASRLIGPEDLFMRNCESLNEVEWTSTYPADMRYSPPGLHAMPFTGPACPVSALTSVQISFSAASSLGWAHRHRRYPPDQPHAKASEPSAVHKPPTKPPRRCPPISPKRCWLTQRADEHPFAPDLTETGDQRMREESVDVESSVSLECPDDEGRQASDVTPASCPTSKASNVTENCCVLQKRKLNNYKWSCIVPGILYLSLLVLTVSMCFFSEIWRPPSSPSSTSPNDASKASSRSSFNSSEVLDACAVRVTASMFHKRMFASWEPDARIKGSDGDAGGRKHID